VSACDEQLVARGEPATHVDRFAFGGDDVAMIIQQAEFGLPLDHKAFRRLNRLFTEFIRNESIPIISLHQRALQERSVALLNRWCRGRPDDLQRTAGHRDRGLGPTPGRSGQYGREHGEFVEDLVGDIPPDCVDELYDIVASISSVGPTLIEGRGTTAAASGTRSLACRVGYHSHVTALDLWPVVVGVRRGHAGASLVVGSGTRRDDRHLSCRHWCNLGNDGNRAESAREARQIALIWIARGNAVVLGGLGILFAWLGLAEFADGVRHMGWSGHIEQLLSVFELGLGTFWVLLGGALVASAIGALRARKWAWPLGLAASLIVGLNALLWIIEYVRPFPIILLTLAVALVLSLSIQRILLGRSRTAADAPRNDAA